jgi:uncharacterized protein
MRHICLLIALSTWGLAAAEAADYQTLQWNDLLPPSAHTTTQPDPAQTINHTGGSAPQLEGSTRPELDHHQVRIPGYVVPIDGDEQSVRTFLLVPFFGACIHVPPPPSNQIVFVTLKEPVSVDELWDAVWVYGTLQTERSSHELANAGYQMQGVRIESYE